MSFDTQLSETLTTLRASLARHQRIVFATSLGREDMALTDLIVRNGLPISIFTLDTGKLHPETVALIDTVRQAYQIALTAIRPDPAQVLALSALQSDTAIYETIEARKRCCAIRKVEPLARALAGANAWVTGQRRVQSVTRAQLPLTELDSAHGIEKINPLALWSDETLEMYLRRNSVPLNTLHAQGFPSIGCAPCTRAIAPGEDERAGRWWWESPEHKECGLHNNPRRPTITIQEVSSI